MPEIIISCVLIALLCVGVVVYITMRPTKGKASKSIFDVGYNHMADNAPQIPQEPQAEEPQEAQTPADEAPSVEEAAESEAEADSEDNA